MRVRALVFGIVFTLAVVPAVFAQERPVWSFSTAIEYSSGDYGTGQDTDVLYIPFTAGVGFDRLGLGVTIPYIRQSSQLVNITGAGVAPRREKRGRRNVTDDEQGLGDILARGSYLVLRDEGALPEVRPFAKIKFPTADEDLGTGEFDVTFGSDVSKTFGPLTPYAALSYTFIGEPPGADFDNTFGWTLGAAYAVTTPFSVFAQLEGATAIAAGQDNPLELRVGFDYALTKVVKVSGSIMRGLSDGSADWGIVAGVGLRF
ncbi:MAG: transporter [Candidatus Rokubacteria bacterium]|nr:transporter [Candidatus Rokubacteria bacterium]